MELPRDAHPFQTTPAAQPVPIGSSSTANRTGDLVLDIKAMFESSKQQFSIGGLVSVPDHLRKVDEQAFTPLLISIGPIHCSNAKLQTLKSLKVRICECLIQEANVDLQNLLYIIGVREKEIRSYYAENVVSSISSDEFVTMILVDGMFILGCLLITFLHRFKEDRSIRLPGWMLPILVSDLVLLENQLPFFVLEMLYQQVAVLNSKNRWFGSLSVQNVAFYFFGQYNFHRVALDDFNLHIEKYAILKDFNRYVEDFMVHKDSSASIEHFTDLVRFFYVYRVEEFLGISHGGANLLYSATQLHEAGVKFKVVEKYDRSFFDMRFDLKRGVMEITCIVLKDENIRLIRNIIALEHSRYVYDSFVTDFFVMLNFLIDDSKDVDLLCDMGILENFLGDGNAAASAIKSLNTNTVYRNGKHLKICEDLNAFYKLNATLWRQWKATSTLWRQYFSTPWRAASTSAAIILLLFTAIQTICSLKSTKW